MSRMIINKFAIGETRSMISPIVETNVEKSVEKNIEINTDSRQQTYFRKGADRRRSYLRALLYSSFKKQRKGQRRLHDNLENTFLDIHEPKLAFILFITLLLCVTDAFLTLSIIERGGREVNPFMLFLMAKDITIFFWVKFLMTAFGMLFLISHKHFTIFRVINGYHLFYSVAAMYSVLVIYEVYLLMLTGSV